MVAKTLVIASGLISAAVTSGPARADPPNFPDLGGYPRVNVQDYTINGPTTGRAPLATVYFRTGDGITCDFFSGAAQCDGYNCAPTPSACPRGMNWIATDTGENQANGPIVSGNKVYGHLITILPTRHSINVAGVICGAVDASTAACKDPQGRGFVLSPGGPHWQAHV